MKLDKPHHVGPVVPQEFINHQKNECAPTRSVSDRFDLVLVPCHFRKWFARLRDERTTTAITSRLDRLAFGHAGDARPIGKGVSELRIHHGSGYRVYFLKHGAMTIVLLCGGEKDSQQRDIRTALSLASQWKE